MEIKDRIRIKRHEKGLTQKQLGELSGIHEVQIRKYERGEVLPKLENIKKIANGLSIRPIDLLGDDWFVVKGSEADGKQTDICATCVHDEPGYCSVIGTIPHCCSRHWHCEPGKAAKDYVPKQEEGEADGKG